MFHKLTRGNVREIAEIFLKKTYKRMKEKNVTLEITPAFKERLVEMVCTLFWQAQRRVFCAKLLLGGGGLP